MSFQEWLRSEIEHVKKIVKTNEKLAVFDLYPQARLRALREAKMAYERASA